MSMFFESMITSYEPLNKIMRKSKIKRQKMLKKTEKSVNLAMLKRNEFLNKTYPSEVIRKQKRIIKPLILINKIATRLSRLKVRVINSYEKTRETPVIFAVCHVCKFDIQIAYECIGAHALTLCGSENTLLGTLEGWFLEKCGVNYVSRWDKKDRANSIKKMEADIYHGVNILWFPEGAWNIYESLLVQPISFSLTNLAVKTRTQIIPVGMERIGNTVYINFGKAYFPGKGNNVLPEEMAMDLRDKLATLKYEIMEKMLMEKRIEIPCDYWQKTLSKYYKEYMLDDWIEEQSYVFKPKGDAYEFFEEFNSVVSYKDGEKIVKRISSEGRCATN